MKFEFATTRENYEHFAAGRVLMSRAGMSAFPLRLASEIFQAIRGYTDKAALRVFDPCGGGAYLLTCLGFLHHEHLAALYAADIAPDAVTMAARNLALLSPAGLDARRATIAKLHADFGKDSHAEALVSVDVLREMLPPRPLPVSAWVADNSQQSLASASMDVLLTDVPYGIKLNWQGSAPADPLYQLLDAQYPVLAVGGIAVIISDKAQKAAHPRYERLRHDVHGKRRITFLKPIA